MNESVSPGITRTSETARSWIGCPTTAGSCNATSCPGPASPVGTRRLASTHHEPLRPYRAQSIAQRWSTEKPSPSSAIPIRLPLNFRHDLKLNRGEQKSASIAKIRQSGSERKAVSRLAECGEGETRREPCASSPFRRTGPGNDGVAQCPYGSHHRDLQTLHGRHRDRSHSPLAHARRQSGRSSALPQRGEPPEATADALQRSVRNRVAGRPGAGRTLSAEQTVAVQTRRSGTLRQGRRLFSLGSSARTKHLSRLAKIYLGKICDLIRASG